MSQEQVLKILEEAHQPLSALEISEKGNIRYQEVHRNLSQMIKYKEVSFIELDRHKARQYFKTKRKLKLYYVGHIKKRVL